MKKNNCFYSCIADRIDLLHFEIQGTMTMMIKLTSVCSRRLCKSLQVFLLFCVQLKKKEKSAHAKQCRCETK